MKHLLAGAALAAALAGAAQAPAADITATGATARVSLKDIAFSPATTRVRRGDRVIWTWRDQYASHDLKSVGRPRFRGESAKRTGTHAVRFRTAGRYRYECTLHPGMRGTVVVR